MTLLSTKTKIKNKSTSSNKMSTNKRLTNLPQELLDHSLGFLNPATNGMDGVDTNLSRMSGSILQRQWAKFINTVHHLKLEATHP